jgi:hypothetical protein
MPGRRQERVCAAPGVSLARSESARGGARARRRARQGPGKGRLAVSVAYAVAITAVTTAANGTTSSRTTGAASTRRRLRLSQRQRRGPRGERAARVSTRRTQPERDLISNEVFAFRPGPLLDALDELAEQAGDHGLEDLGHELLLRLVDAGEVREHRFDGYWRYVGTIPAYWACHKALVQEDRRSTSTIPHGRSSSRPRRTARRRSSWPEPRSSRA